MISFNYILLKDKEAFSSAAIAANEDGSLYFTLLNISAKISLSFAPHSIDFDYDAFIIVEGDANNSPLLITHGKVIEITGGNNYESLLSALNSKADASVVNSIVDQIETISQQISNLATTNKMCSVDNIAYIPSNIAIGDVITLIQKNPLLMLIDSAVVTSVGAQVLQNYVYVADSGRCLSVFTQNLHTVLFKSEETPYLILKSNSLLDDKFVLLYGTYENQRASNVGYLFVNWDNVVQNQDEYTATISKENLYNAIASKNLLANPQYVTLNPLFTDSGTNITCELYLEYTNREKNTYSYDESGYGIASDYIGNGISFTIDNYILPTVFPGYAFQFIITEEGEDPYDVLDYLEDSDKIIATSNDAIDFDFVILVSKGYSGNIIYNVHWDNVCKTEYFGELQYTAYITKQNLLSQLNDDSNIVWSSGVYENSDSIDDYRLLISGEGGSEFDCGLHVIGEFYENDNVFVSDVFVYTPELERLAKGSDVNLLKKDFIQFGKDSIFYNNLQYSVFSKYLIDTYKNDINDFISKFIPKNLGEFIYATDENNYVLNEYSVNGDCKTINIKNSFYRSMYNSDVLTDDNYLKQYQYILNNGNYYAKYFDGTKETNTITHENGSTSYIHNHNDITDLLQSALDTDYLQVEIDIPDSQYDTNAEPIFVLIHNGDYILGSFEKRANSIRDNLISYIVSLRKLKNIAYRWFLSNNEEPIYFSPLYNGGLHEYISILHMRQVSAVSFEINGIGQTQKLITSNNISEYTLQKPQTSSYEIHPEFEQGEEINSDGYPSGYDRYAEINIDNSDRNKEFDFRQYTDSFYIRINFLSASSYEHTFFIPVGSEIEIIDENSSLRYINSYPTDSDLKDVILCIQNNVAIFASIDPAEEIEEIEE